MDMDEHLAIEFSTKGIITMLEAARVGDIIGHSKSMWGMLVGTILGAAIAIGGAMIFWCINGCGYCCKLHWYWRACHWCFHRRRLRNYPISRLGSG